MWLRRTVQCAVHDFIDENATSTLLAAEQEVSGVVCGVCKQSCFTPHLLASAGDTPQTTLDYVHPPWVTLHTIDESDESDEDPRPPAQRITSEYQQHRRGPPSGLCLVNLLLFSSTQGVCATSRPPFFWTWRFFVAVLCLCSECVGGTSVLAQSVQRARQECGGVEECWGAKKSGGEKMTMLRGERERKHMFWFTKTLATHAARIPRSPSFAGTLSACLRTQGHCARESSEHFFLECFSIVCCEHQNTRHARCTRRAHMPLAPQHPLHLRAHSCSAGTSRREDT